MLVGNTMHTGCSRQYTLQTLSPSISFKIPVAPHKAAPDVSKIGNLLERLVVVIHGWQSEPFDGPKGGWSCVFGVVAMVAVVTPPQLLDVVWCNAVVVVVVVVVVV